MSANVGYATLNIIPSAKDFGRNLTKEVTPALDSAGKTGGSALADGVSKAFGFATTFVLGSIAAIGGGILGLAVHGGFSRALKLDEARTKLTALNYTTDQSRAITENALASVKGTAFGLDSAVSSAVGLLAAGIQPGEQLQGVLTTISNTAALAGTSMDEMGSIFGKVAANGKVTTEEMNQLADRGVPIWQYLGESIGVNNSELRKMIETGQVTADMFFNGLGPAVEGVAVKMGTSFKGMLANAKASLGRLGALFAGPILESSKGLLGVFTDLSDRLGTYLAPYAAAFGAALAGIDWATVAAQVGELAKKAFDLVTTFSPGVALFNALKPVLPQLTAALIPLGQALSSALVALLPSLLPLLETLTNLLVAVLPVVTNLAVGIINMVTAVIQWGVANKDIVGTLATVGGVIAGVVVGVKAFKAAQLLLTAATYGTQGAMLLAGNSAKVFDIGLKAWSATTKAAAAVQAAFNVVMSANPIGIIITAIAALVAGLIYFFTQTETGKAIWAAFTKFLSEAWTNIVNFAKTVWGALASFFTDLWTNISSFFTTVWTAIADFAVAIFTPIVDFFVGLWTGVSNAFTATWDAIVAFLTPVFEFIAALIKGYIDIWVGIFLILAAALKVVWDGIVTAVTTAWNAIVAFVTPIVDAIVAFVTSSFETFLKGWQVIWTAVSSFFSDIWNAIVAFVTPIINGIRDTITTVVAAIRLAWETYWSAVSAVFSAIWNGIVSFLTPIINGIRNTITSVVNGIRSTWESVWSAISSFFSEIWNGMVSAVTGAVGNVVSVVSGIQSKVMSAINGIGDWLFSAGGDLIRGLWNGITNVGDWLRSKITGFFDGAVGWAKDILGIHSPSKRFAELGVYVGQGFGNGIDSMTSSVAASARGLGQAAIDAVDGMPDLAIGAHLNGTADIASSVPEGGMYGVMASARAGGSSTTLNYTQVGGQGLTAAQELVRASRQLKHIP
ncbi:MULTISPECIES: phage tail protein [unclassified Microbacterium]|uniref:phage tail protein n=1 Tax=unclassified Microbacterium TaxID=2609290 RepID=UPI00301599A1